MRLVIFGTGKVYKKSQEYLEQHTIVSFLDNDKNKQGAYIDGTICLPPDNICQLEYDYVVILSLYVDEMYNQLIDLGVPRDKILFQHECFSLLAKSNTQMELKKQVLMIFHEYSLSGAALCFFDLSCILTKMGYHVVALCAKDGPLRSKMQKGGMDARIDALMSFKTLKDYEDAENYSAIFINTIVPYYLLSNRNDKIPVMWWVHEPIDLYKNVKRSIAHSIHGTNMHVYAVSNIAQEGMKTFFPHLDVSMLPYGVETISKKPTKKIVCIGNIERLKGQDILIKAIEQCEDSVKNRIDVFCIGRAEGDFFDNWKEYASGRELPIHFLGMQEHETVLSVINSADLLICPSRKDSLPVNIVEAFMLRVPVISSDATGMVSIIKNYEAGYVFKSENVSELSALIEKIVTCGAENHMLDNAQRAVNEIFRHEIFENSIIKSIEKMRF